jgi:hypothetical protein
VTLADPQIVRVPGATRYIPVPDDLTEPTPAPADPVPMCVGADRWPVLCETQIALWLLAWRVALDLANADKLAIRQLQPKAVPAGDTQ